LISPASSATGMNSAGEIMPRSGCRQRSSASQPVTCVYRKPYPCLSTDRIG
jgi:hypothetical protein